MELVLYGLAAIGVSAIMSDTYMMVPRRNLSWKERAITAISVIVVHAVVFSCGATLWVFLR